MTLPPNDWNWCDRCPLMRILTGSAPTAGWPTRNRIGSPCAFSLSKTTATPPTIWSRRSARSAMSPTPPIDGEDGLAMALDGQYDVLIVDRMLPKRDGLSVIGTLRDKGYRNAGADPFRAWPGRRPGQGTAGWRRRLSAQALFILRAAGARRGAGAPPRRPQRGNGYRVGDLELDRLSHQVHRGKRRNLAAAARIPACWNT